MAAILVTDLKQWAYCQRIVYYRRVMPGVGRATYKMREGKRAQEMIEALEMRRTLREYGLESARRVFGLWIEDRELGLGGKLDLLLEGDTEAAVVDFKLTSGEPGENHRMQLAGYALLAGRSLGKPVRRGFLYRIPDNRVFPVAITSPLLEEAMTAIESISSIAVRQRFPPATLARARCEDCEYANYCGDVW